MCIYMWIKLTCWTSQVYTRLHVTYFHLKETEQSKCDAVRSVFCSIPVWRPEPARRTAGCTAVRGGSLSRASERNVALLCSSLSRCHSFFLFTSLSSSVNGNDTPHLAKLESAMRENEFCRMQLKLPFLYIKMVK